MDPRAAASWSAAARPTATSLTVVHIGVVSTGPRRSPLRMGMVAQRGDMNLESAPAEPGSAPTVVKISTPADIVSLIPHRVGFHPTESLVALSLGGPRMRDQVAMRCDLPPRSEEDDFVDHFAQMLDKSKADGAVLVCYTDEPPCARALQRHRMIRRLRRELRRRGIEVVEALLVHEGRWWSYLCHGRGCCDPDGTPVPPVPTAAAMRYAVETVARGAVVHEDRAALAATVEPLPGVEAAAARAVGRVAAGDSEPGLELALAALVPELDADDVDDEDDEAWWARQLRGGVPPVVGLLERLRGEWAEGRCAITDEEALQIARDLWRLVARAYALTLVLDGQREALVALLSEVARRTPDRLAGPVCGVLAWCAQAAGNGALALVAAERSLRCQPDSTVALLVLAGVEQMQPPSYVLDAAANMRASLTPLDAAG